MTGNELRAVRIAIRVLLRIVDKTYGGTTPTGAYIPDDRAKYIRALALDAIEELNKVVAL